MSQQMMREALRKAYLLGQTYWQQADSEYISQQNKSEATHQKYLALVEESIQALAASEPVQPAKLPTTSKWVLREVYFDEDGNPAMHREPAVVQQEWSLDQEQAKFLADYILADPDEPTAITLSVGFVKDDDGNIEHGLRLIDTEYPEEGAVMLVESEPNEKRSAVVQWFKSKED